VADLLTAVRHHAEHATHGWAEGGSALAPEKVRE
jgi:hypothetical protein